MRTNRIIRRDRSQAMVIRENKILLVKHQMCGREFFCLPGGGIEEGETPEEAAVRELKEEGGVEGRIVRRLSIQFKSDNRGEVHTFLIQIPGDAVPSKGMDPELPHEEQTIVSVEWLTLEEIGAVDQAYLWAAGLNRIDYFHKYLLNMENKLYK